MSSFHFLLTGNAQYSRSDMITMAGNCGGRFHTKLLDAHRRHKVDNQPIYLVVGRPRAGVGESKKIQEARAHTSITSMSDEDFLARPDMAEEVDRMLSKVCVVP
jgi:hypothetical protein